MLDEALKVPAKVLYFGYPITRLVVVKGNQTDFGREALLMTFFVVSLMCRSNRLPFLDTVIGNGGDFAWASG